MAQHDLLQAHAAAEAERARAFAPDRAGRHVQRPDALAVHPQFRVDRPVGQPQRCGGLPHGCDHAVLRRLRKARGGDVDRLLEVRPIERVRLVEDREREQFAAAQQSLDRHLVAADETLHHEAVSGVGALVTHVGHGEQPPQPFRRAQERSGVVRADHAAAAVEAERLDHDRIRDLRRGRRQVVVEVQHLPGRRRQPARGQPFAQDRFVARAEHGRCRVRRQQQLLRGARREQRARIVHRDHRVQREAVGITRHRRRAALGIAVGQRQPAARIHVRQRLLDVRGDHDVEAELAGGRHEVGRAVRRGRDQQHHAGHGGLQGISSVCSAPRRSEPPASYPEGDDYGRPASIGSGIGPHRPHRGHALRRLRAPRRARPAQGRRRQRGLGRLGGRARGRHRRRRLRARGRDLRCGQRSRLSRGVRRSGVR